MRQPLLPNRSRSRSSPPVAGWFALVFVVGFAAPAEGVYREGFDTPTPTWRLWESDCGARLATRERVFQQASVHSGAGAEYLRILAGQGSHVYVLQEVAHARVIHELRPSIWVKANRPGIQLLARVVFPRSRDPRDGSPVTVLVEGDAYNQPGEWRQLTLREIALQVQRKARIKRGQQQFGSDVDEREAYLDAIVLNAYGGAGVTDLWVDDLEIQGYSEVEVASLSASDANTNDTAWRSAGPNENPFPTAPGQDKPPHLEGGVVVAGRGPVAVRLIEHCGEPFAWLQSLGFNGVRLARPPTPVELHEARRLGLWIVAPPPHATGRSEITLEHDCVLAWDLGNGVGVRELETVRQLANEVRRDDPRQGRPVLVGPRERLWSYRRLSDILLLGDEPLGTDLGIAEYRDRLVRQARSGSRPAPFWAMIQTEPCRALRDQFDALTGEPFDASVEAAQVRLLVLAALQAGATGLCFRSRAPLDGSEPASAHRAAVLHAVNQELSLLEPWVAGPSHHETRATSVQGVEATVWATDRSQLILLAQHHADDQHTAAACPPQSVPLLIAGTPPSWKAFRVQADRLAPLAESLVGGGMRVVVPDVGRSALVVVTDDPLTVNYLARRQRQGLAPWARMRYDLMTRELTAAINAVAGAPDDIPSREEVTQRLEEARAALLQCQRLLDASEFAGSLRMAELTEQPLTQARRLLWLGAAGGFATASASPFCGHVGALPLHWELARRTRVGVWGPNSLAAGDFEEIHHLRSANWTQIRNADFPGKTWVELSPDRPRQGRFALRLGAAEDAAGAERDASLEGSLVKIVSAPTPIPRGAVFRIRVWTRVAAPLSEGRPVLRLTESFGGESLALHHGASDEWRLITLYRVATRPEPLTFALELLEPGDVWIDAASVEILEEGADSGSRPRAPPHQGAQGLSARQAETLTQ